MELKRAKVVMLPTKTGIIACNRHTNKLWIKTQVGLKNYSNGFVSHLYFITNDEIKEGDWFINIVQKEIYNHHLGGYNVDKGYLKKIIASTDPKLTKVEGTIQHLNSLPRPSKAFIEKYCQAGGIDEVMVEVDSIEYHGILQTKGRIVEFDNRTYNPNFGKLKVNSHNTITIRPVKTEWTVDELRAAAQEMLKGKSLEAVAEFLNQLTVS